MENFFYQTFIFLFTPGDEGKGGCHTMDREGGGGAEVDFTSSYTKKVRYLNECT